MDLFANQQKYVRVVPELSLEKLFDYVVPEHLDGQVLLGHRLKVPFGKKTIFAYAVSFPTQPQVDKCRPIESISGNQPLIPPALMELAHWVSEYYCCDFSTALKTLLPEAVRAKEEGHKMQLWVELLQVDFDKIKKSPAQQKAVEYLQQNPKGWLADYLVATETTQAVWKALAEKNIISLGKSKKERNPFHTDVAPDQDHTLNGEQRSALDMVFEEMKSDRPQPILLQGVTGSGKTEVYLQALTEVLKKKKTALILVPEISLTPQTVQRFRQRFEHLNVNIAVLHSNLSSGERYDQWHIIAEQKAQVVIGARSAIFAPLQDLGMIVVDEEHDGGYKQEETPHYHARDLAVMRGHLEKIPVVLGSATPSLESVLNAQEKKYKFAKLSERAAEIRMPTIHIVDMRQEKFVKGDEFMVSAKLKEAITQRLDKKEQTILFLNRRGFSTSVQCPKCGHVEKCTHCDIPFTFHRTTRKLRCHLCDEVKGLPQKCPECQYDDFGYLGYGTQKVEDVVAKIFPTARWQRVDSDSMSSKHAYELTMEEFHKGNIDLLLGTQMITKGLHFPNVTCVGVINCDKALNLPDFRASERSFQQMVQVAGRAGRGDIHGEVFFQTYSPFHPAIQFARHHDVDGFQDQELEFRKAHEYPPYSRMIMVSFRGPSEDKVKYCIEMVARHLESIKDFAHIEEPAPAPIAKLRDEYRYQLFIKTKQVLLVNRELRKQVLDVEWPEGIRCTINVDPLNLM